MKLPYVILSRQIREGAVWRVWVRLATEEARKERLKELRKKHFGVMEFKEPE